MIVAPKSVLRGNVARRRLVEDIDLPRTSNLNLPMVPAHFARMSRLHFRDVITSMRGPAALPIFAYRTQGCEIEGMLHGLPVTSIRARALAHRESRRISAVVDFLEVEAERDHGYSVLADRLRRRDGAAALIIVAVPLPMVQGITRVGDLAEFGLNLEVV